MHSVVFGLIASLALLCAIVYAGTRNQSALLWLAAALVCGCAETVLLAKPVNTYPGVAAVACLLPAAYLCFSQSIRALLRLRSVSRFLFGSVAALTAMSLALLWIDAPALHQTLPFQVASALCLFDSIRCLLRRKDKDMLDKSLLAILSCIAMLVMARMPLFPLLFDPAGLEVAIRQSTLQRLLLTAAVVTTPASVLLILAKIVSGVIAGHRQHSELDYLTNLPNRRSFERTSSGTSKSGGAVIVCDIDQFKQINDRYGHAVGDDIIRLFASLLHGHEGSPARLGGEEFALLLPGATVERANAQADAIRKRFHALRYPAFSRDHRLSASFGVAGFTPGETAQGALVRADDALYRAKNDGRNRVVACSKHPDDAGALRVA